MGRVRSGPSSYSVALAEKSHVAADCCGPPLLRSLYGYLLHPCGAFVDDGRLAPAFAAAGPESRGRGHFPSRVQTDSEHHLARGITLDLHLCSSGSSFASLWWPYLFWPTAFLSRRSLPLSVFAKPVFSN